MEAIDYLKAKTGDDNEALLLSCIADAEGDILTFITPDVIPDKLKPMVRKLALWYYNRNGIEGMASFSEAGTSQSMQALTENEIAILQNYREFSIGGYVDGAKKEPIKPIDESNFDDVED